MATEGERRPRAAAGRTVQIADSVSTNRLRCYKVRSAQNTHSARSGMPVTLRRLVTCLGDVMYRLDRPEVMAELVVRGRGIDAGIHEGYRRVEPT